MRWKKVPQVWCCGIRRPQSVLHVDLAENGRLVISRGEFYTLKAHTLHHHPV